MTEHHGACLRHIGIRTRDIARTADFYATVFGLKRLRMAPDGGSAVLGDGVMNITIVPVVGEAAAPVAEGAEPIHLGFIVPDLLATFQRCREWGAPILAGDVASRDPLPEGALPRTSFKVADPNGNVIDVMGDPNYWLGARL